MLRTKIQALVAVTVIGGGVLSGLALSAPSVSAVPPTPVVHTITAIDGSQGFGNAGNAATLPGDALAISAFADPTYNDGSLHMATGPTSASHVSMLTALNSAQGQLNDISYSADLLQGASPPTAGADISLNVTAYCNVAAATGFATFVFEPYENQTGDNPAIALNQWQTWDASQNGQAKWWTNKYFSTTPGGGLLSSNPGGGAVGGQAGDVAWSTFTAAFFNACPGGGFTGIGFNLGSANPNINGYADNLAYTTTAGSVIDDFAVPAATVHKISALDGSQGFGITEDANVAGTAGITSATADTVAIDPFADPTYNDGSLHLATPLASGHVTVATAVTAGPGQLNDISYAAYLKAPINSAADAALNVTAFCNLSAQTGFDTFVYEPYENIGLANPADGTWQTWNASNGGAAIWWTTHPFSANAGGGVSPASGPTFGGQSDTKAFTLLQSEFFSACPAGGFTSIGLNLGSSNAGGDVYADSLSYNTPSTGSVIDDFSIAAPTVSAVSPNRGPVAGGNTVTITGTNLGSATAVHFGTAAASIVAGSDSATSLRVVAPAGAFAQDVTVTTEGGTSATSPADVYTYYAAPTITSLNPAFGPAVGGTSVTITGTSFSFVTAVQFGTKAATSYTVNSSTSITAVAPAGTGVVSVTVAAAGGSNAATGANQYSYQGATVLVAQPSVLGLSLLHGLTLLAGPTATLTSGGVPVAGQSITFTSGLGGTICTATTNASGTATCGSAAVLATVLGLGYTAHYAGTSAYLPSSASGTIVEILVIG